MNDENLRKKYQAVHPVGDYGIPFRPDNLIFFPKALDNATARFPVFSVPDKDKPHQYAETIKTIKVTRFYVKHHPNGYMPEHKEYGDGSENDPFLDFKNACSKIDCFLNNSCRGKVQIIIMSGSSPLDSSCSHSFAAPYRVILGATDEQLYFEVSKDCSFAVRMISQCKAAKDTRPMVRIEPLYRRELCRRRGVNNVSSVCVLHERDTIQSSIEHKEYTEVYATYRSSFYLAKLPCTLFSSEVVENNDYSTRTFGYDYMVSAMYLDTEDNLIVEWQDGQRSVFIKKNNSTWVLPGVFHAPDLYEYRDCEATLYSTGEISIKGKYKIKFERFKQTDAIWLFANNPEDEEWTSAGGAIYTLKDDQPDKYVTTADLFLYEVSQYVKPVFWQCKHINIDVSVTGLPIVFACTFVNNNIFASIVYNCQAHNSVVNSGLIDKCVVYDCTIHCDPHDYNCVSRTKITHSKTQTIDCYQISYCDIIASDLTLNRHCAAEHSSFIIASQIEFPFIFSRIETCMFDVTSGEDFTGNHSNNSFMELDEGGFCHNTEIKIKGKATMKAYTQSPYADRRFVILRARDKQPIISNITIDSSAIECRLEFAQGASLDSIGCYKLRIYDITIWPDNDKCITGCTVKQWGNECDD